MKRLLTILTIVSLIFPPVISRGQDKEDTIRFDFCDQPISFVFDPYSTAPALSSLSAAAVQAFYDNLNTGIYHTAIQALLDYKQANKPDDWLFYQLIRKTAQQLSPKNDDYLRYTLFKWFLLAKTGYGAFPAISENKVLLYVRCDQNIYDIPTRMVDGKQYVCLNYHDYGNVDFNVEKFEGLLLSIPEAAQVFSYKITHLPDFKLSDYQDRELSFSYNEQDYYFKVKLNPQVKTLFTNYPVVDYELYMNIPLSRETYQSLIPLLKKNVKGLKVKSGVDYLMRFTRYAFLFESDTKVFGGEKRLSPEQTLLYRQSDCEDRVALFFYLVKEIYNLPMIVLNYPHHVTIGVQFDKPVGKPIVYNGIAYSVCEPTPQKVDLNMGQLLPALRKEAYDVAYVYTPQ